MVAFDHDFITATEKETNVLAHSLKGSKCFGRTSGAYNYPHLSVQCKLHILRSPLTAPCLAHS